MKLKYILWIKAQVKIVDSFGARTNAGSIGDL